MLKEKPFTNATYPLPKMTSSVLILLLTNYNLDSK